MSKEVELNEAIARDIMELGPADPQPHFSANIGASFNVLQKLHSKGWFWRLDSVHDGVICTLQAIPADSKDFKTRITYTIRAATAAQAICECAIKTVGPRGTP